LQDEHGGGEFFEGRCYTSCIALKIACKFRYGRTLADSTNN